MACPGLRVLSWFGQGLAWLPQGLLLALSWLLLPLLWWPLRRRRRIAAINLALCFPELTADARRRLLRHNLQETLMGAFDLLRAWFAPAFALRGRYRIEGLDELRAALAQGQGALLLLSHFTATELAMRMLSDALGRRVRGVVRRYNSPCMEAEVSRARHRQSLPSLAKKDLRGLLRALQAGEVVGRSGDQDFSYQNAFVPFFGVAASTLTGTAALAARAGVPVFLLWSRREANGQYRICIEREWPGWRESTPEQQAAAYMRALELEVRKAPAQYLWVHRRFKTRPPGEAPLYP